MAVLRPCPGCKHLLHPTARSCPQCGFVRERAAAVLILKGVIVIALASAILYWLWTGAAR